MTPAGQRARARRGVTLVETMIAVALVGILAGVGGALAVTTRNAATDELARERAAQLLEYEADCLSTGRPVDAAVVEALQGALPGARVSTVRQGRTATITVEWHRGATKASRALTIFTKESR